MKKHLAASILFLSFHICKAQNVGIGTTSPKARLHVTDSAVLFTGPAALPFTTSYPPPASGPGTRLFWYPQKAAFRVGTVGSYFNLVGDKFWDKDSIGQYSFAAGLNTKAQGVITVSMGHGSTATGAVATSMGYKTIASADASTSMGYMTVASGYAANSMGFSTRAAGYSSASMGFNTIARSDYSLVAGQFNDTTATNRLFEVGNGTADDDRSNALTIINTGNIGIGTTSPAQSAKLEIADTAKGVLIPRLTKNQRNNISAPPSGLLVFNSTDNEFNYYKGSQWVPLLNGDYDTVMVAFGSANTFTGSSVDWTVPDNVYQIKAELYGPAGGNVRKGTGVNIGLIGGGNGGVISGMINVSPGQVLHLFLGGTGAGYIHNGGGFNGGGVGSNYYYYSGTQSQGIAYGGGGGATDIRIGGTSLANRVIVAGGGGGAYINTEIVNDKATGGCGGYPTGCKGDSSAVNANAHPGWGGTQAAGGVNYGGGSAGTSGIGGSNGGGGGYYGGAGGSLSAGGGGSSWADPSVSNVQYRLNFNDNALIKISYIQNKLATPTLATGKIVAGVGYAGRPATDKLEIYGNLYQEGDQTVIGNEMVFGNIGIGTYTPTGPLSFDNLGGNKIVLYGDGNTSHYGVGVQSNALQLYTDAPAADILLGSGSSTAFTERMRIINSGANAMTLNGRVTLRNGTTDTNNSPGIWFNSPNNATLASFLGTQGNQTVGFYGGPNGWGFVYDAANSRVGIGTTTPSQALQVAGNILASGTITPSDARYKKNISTIKAPLEKLSLLNGVTYNYRSADFPAMKFSDQQQVGLIAQDVEKVFPQLVFEDEKGYKGVDYVKLVPLLIEAIKSQEQLRRDDLARIKMLEEQSQQQQQQNKIQKEQYKLQQQQIELLIKKIAAISKK